MRVISWNLLRLVGAGVKDVAALIERHHPDLLLMQEATEEVAALPSLVGGHFFRVPLSRRIYGLAAWSPHPFPRPHALPLPVSPMPGRVPPRLAQIVKLGDVTFANVHLSHGQLLNRRQFLVIARSLDAPSAIIGDYNAVGPIELAGFRDVGPRQPTLLANNIISFRLDRCLALGLRCTHTQVLARGPSDHHPILLDLSVVPDETRMSEPQFAARGDAEGRTGAAMRANVGSWLRAISQSPDRIRVPQSFAEMRNLTKARRRAAHRAAVRQPEEDRSLG